MRWEKGTKKKKEKESQYSNKTIENRLEGGQFKVQSSHYGFDVRIFEVGTLQEQGVDIVPVVVSAKSRGKDGKSS
ncbi:hypothetical protein V1477_000594 [Vespula maculifrons]|uniref:Uncharacterized protein n=1 Tax=Vespula maculifrons TaxID=7453 RepID=A0ABD2D231_VESMC